MSVWACVNLFLILLLLLCILILFIIFSCLILTIWLQVRGGAAATTAKGQITANKLCGQKTGYDASSCMTHKITCGGMCGGGAIPLVTYITVQWVEATSTYLMLDEVTWA